LREKAIGGKFTFANSAGGTLSPLLSQPSCSFWYASLTLPCFSHNICLNEIKIKGNLRVSETILYKKKESQKLEDL